MLEINNKTRNKIDLELVHFVVKKFLKENKKIKYTVSVVFIGDSLIRRLNKKYRGKDKVTDVLSFPDSGTFLGEILIDYAQIKRQAKKYSASINDELVFILVHGLLHLIGYNDESEKEANKMDMLGRAFISKIKKL